MLIVYHVIEDKREEPDNCHTPTQFLPASRLFQEPQQISGSFHFQAKLLLYFTFIQFGSSFGCTMLKYSSISGQLLEMTEGNKKRKTLEDSSEDPIFQWAKEFNLTSSFFPNRFSRVIKITKNATISEAFRVGVPIRISRS